MRSGKSALSFKFVFSRYSAQNATDDTFALSALSTYNMSQLAVTVKSGAWSVQVHTSLTPRPHDDFTADATAEL